MQELTKVYLGLAKFKDNWAAIRILKARIKNARIVYMAIAKKAEDEEAGHADRRGTDENPVRACKDYFTKSISSLIYI